MKKKIIAIVVLLLFLYLSLLLFQYFSYWGLGLSLVLLVTAVSLMVLSLLVVVILRHKKIIWSSIQSAGRALMQTKIWQRTKHAIQKKWPRLYNFLRRRLTIDSPAGLYLTTGSLIAASALFSFFGITFDILLKDPLYLADLRTIHLLRTLIAESHIRFFIFFTNLANTSSIIIIGVAVSTVLLMFKRPRTTTHFLITIASGYGAYWLTKIIFHRPRPHDVYLIALPQSSSFPSGHAVMAICLYGFITYLLFRQTKRVLTKTILIAGGMVVAATIGISRVYLGVHYPSDVLAGWHLGFAILILGITHLEIKNKFYPRLAQPLINTRLKNVLAAAIITVALALIYQSYQAIPITKPNVSPVATDITQLLKVIPRYSENLFAQPMEPISFIILGRQQNIFTLFQTAGWHRAEPPRLLTLLQQSSAIAKNVNYTTAPMTPAFYDGRANDHGFEKATADNTARQRHHTRYWQTKYVINGNTVWVATASLDSGIEVGSVINLPTHKIDPDIDEEREFIINDFKKTNLLGTYKKIDFVGQTTGINAAGDEFFTDGKAYVIELK